MSILKTLTLCALLSSAAQIPLISTAAAEPLKIMSWNFEWLSSQSSVHVNESQRTNADLNAYQVMIERYQPKVLAFQEVNDREVLEKVLGKQYKIIMSDRAKSRYQSLQHNGINQYTGVAIDQSLAHSDPEDLVLSPKRKLRFATYVVVEPKASSPIHLLSVHLKAGCIGKYESNEDSCQTLKQQSDSLNQWIQQRLKNKQSYLIVGDFNHDLTHPKDWMWKRIIADNQTPPVLLSSQLKSRCIASGKTKAYRHVVDHIIASSDIRTDNLVQVLYSEQDQEHQLSDHCPLTATLEY